MPGIQRVSFLQNYGDMNDEEVVEFINDVKANSRAIYDEATKIPRPFYIKVMGKSYSKYDVSKVDVSSGIYRISKDACEKWRWDFDRQYPEHSGEIVDLEEKDVYLDLNAVSLVKDQEIQKGRQIMRINGVATPESAPFAIDENGISVLNKNWIPVIDSLYEQIIDSEQHQENMEQTNINNDTNCQISENNGLVGDIETNIGDIQPVLPEK